MNPITYTVSQSSNPQYVAIIARLGDFHAVAIEETATPQPLADLYREQLKQGIVVGQLAALVDAARLDLFAEIENAHHRSERAMLVISEYRARERERDLKNGDLQEPDEYQDDSDRQQHETQTAAPAAGE
jgi:hypothetical protein